MLSSYNSNGEVASCLEKLNVALRNVHTSLTLKENLHKSTFMFNTVSNTSNNVDVYT